MSGIPPIMDPSLVKIPLSGIYYSVLKKWESTRPAPEGHLSGPGYFTADLLWKRFLPPKIFRLGGPMVHTTSGTDGISLRFFRGRGMKSTSFFASGLLGVALGFPFEKRAACLQIRRCSSSSFAIKEATCFSSSATRLPSSSHRGS